MAMQLGGSGGVKSDINVTPLVDVMLVLLIIMMIVAPLLQQGVAVTLPIATNTSEKPETQEQTVVAITADKRFFVNAVQVQQNDLARRIHEHKSGEGSGFTARYGVQRLVWYEEHFDMRDAIQREKSLKRWLRQWKIDLIEKANPDWNELFVGMGW